MAIGNRLRFEILKRDGFRCRYCGATANGGRSLHVDHVKPRAKGGKNDSENLITACSKCNLGKSDIELNQQRLGGDGYLEELMAEIKEIGFETLREYIEDLKNDIRKSSKECEEAADAVNKLIKERDRYRDLFRQVDAVKEFLELLNGCRLSQSFFGNQFFALWETHSLSEIRQAITKTRLALKEDGLDAPAEGGAGRRFVRFMDNLQGWRSSSRQKTGSDHG